MKEVNPPGEIWKLLPRRADEDTEAHRGEAICPGSLIRTILGPRLELELIQLPSPALPGAPWLEGLLGNKKPSDILLRTGFHAEH